MAKAGTFKRADGKFAWHLIASNGNVLCGDLGQGYENEPDAEYMMAKILSGSYGYTVANSILENHGFEVPDYVPQDEEGDSKDATPPDHTP